MTVDKIDDSSPEFSITSSKPPLTEEQEGVNSVAVGTLTSTKAIDGAEPLNLTVTDPKPESSKANFLAKGTIGNQRGRIEFALVHKIVTTPRTGKQARENARIDKLSAKEDRKMDRIEKSEAKSDRKEARKLLGDAIYFGLLEDLMQQQIVKDEAEFDAALNKMLMDETFYNNMMNLMEGRIEGEMLGRPAQ